MFEAYLDGQLVDPRARNRLLAAGSAAAVAMGVAGTLTILAQMLDIDRVVPAEWTEPLTMHVTVQPPPAARPPPRPEAPQRAAVSEQSPPRHAATASAAPLEDAKRSVGEDGTPPDGSDAGASETPVGFGDGASGPCLPPACVVGVPNTGLPSAAGPGSRRSGSVPSEDAREPIDVLRARARFDPNPDSTALARTPTALGSRRAGSTTIDFCVGPSGKVDSARVKRSFGDPRVDAIARATVKRWRFDPLRVAGKAKRSCSSVTFQIEFD